MGLKPKLLAVSIAAVMLAACDGDDGRNGVNGTDGIDGSTGLSSLTTQTNIADGDATCFNGGVRIDSGVDANSDGILSSSEIDTTNYVCNAANVNSAKNFQRIATFPVCLQMDATCDVDDETVAEIVAASSDGKTLIYTDSQREVLGFTDITNPEQPAALGVLPLAGEPTSVGVAGDYALAAVNTSADFINTSGELVIVDIATQTAVRTIELGGQPDSVAISPDGQYAAIAIENERDEDLNDGALPQAPAGYLVVVNLAGEPAAWTSTNIDMTGLADIAAGDPEPEYVDINSDNIAVVTFQENNYLVLVDLASGAIVNHFSAGTVNLTQIDNVEEDPAIISQTDSLDNIPREPDGVTWLNSEYFVTANEGDWQGGSRGFTVFNTEGEVIFDSGNSLDHLTVQLGQYPDGRSENKGNEPENAEFGVFGSERFLFVNSERSSLVFVYDVADFTKPAYKQTLPAALGPEGVVSIPSRNLLVAASEEDARGDKFRGSLNIYRYGTQPASYPTLYSTEREDGTPIPWSAMSGLAADPLSPNTLYSIEDSFYGKSRIFTIDTSSKPALLTHETRISDAKDVFAGISTVALMDPSVSDDDPTRADVFDEADLALLINDDKTINVDPEGIAVASDGGFWVASEGSGTVGDAGRPVNSLNFIFKTDAYGVIESVITLPAAVSDNQLRFGFEGVAEYNGAVYVAFQRVWPGDSAVRIGVYNIAGASWSFLNYTLDAPESQNGGWVGLSDLTSLDDGQFMVVERDNQAGPDAAIKRLYRFDVTGLVDGDTVTKTLVRDLIPDLAKAGGLIAEKIEGMALSADGDVWIINDNDGVDDNSGETQLLNLGPILD
ncbi:esterase-like activity of phytase family protein [Halioxenophilus sp. WMMB6]|uniref:esterase-like activity of phytase family protein n=1 Tax=Halioxenophilus sp. WMMB6 TaxID=3073815 RepID=UPI00295F0903|nr:esterase-like activity of phytase family protein [Halioxenophilus sp. WMMB6]